MPRRTQRARHAHPARRTTRRPRVALAAAALALAGAAGCGSTPGSEGAAGGGGADAIGVVAAFYPLEHAVREIGGDRVRVTGLTKPGAEPHDLEMTPKDVVAVTESRLAVYEKGMQPALDQAISDQGLQQAFDVSGPADLSLSEPEGAGHEGHDHGTEAGATDPHFWLDPIRYQKVAQAIATRLGEVDPDHKAEYDRNAQRFVADLGALDAEFEAGLARCASDDLVTSHAAFAYLADRYGLHQVPIAGLEPDAEPDPARLAQISRFVRTNKVGTIYTETLASPAVAKTVAGETGAKMAVLDPIEGLTDSSQGSTYLEIMRANLAALKKGQGCS